MHSYFPIASLMSLVPVVLAHGIISSPTPRMPGAAMKAACGEQVYNNQASDSLGNIQGILQVASSQSDYNAAKCNVWLCKGYQFADNSANIKTFTPGQVVDMSIRIGAPHTGTANVSIVDTAANAVIGSQLIYFSDYASVAHTIPANNTAFSITMPTNLGSKCATAGNCVIQWFWNAPTISQTYESCIDFTMSGSGSSAPAPSTAIPTTLVTLASTAAPTTLSTPVANTNPSNMTSPASTTPADDCEDEPATTPAAAASTSETDCDDEGEPTTSAPATDETDCE